MPCGERRENVTRSQKALFPPLLVIPVTATRYHCGKQALGYGTVPGQHGGGGTGQLPYQDHNGCPRADKRPKLRLPKLQVNFIPHSPPCPLCRAAVYTVARSLRHSQTPPCLPPSLMLSSLTCWDNLNLPEGFHTS